MIINTTTIYPPEYKILSRIEATITHPMVFSIEQNQYYRQPKGFLHANCAIVQTRKPTTYYSSTINEKQKRQIDNNIQ